MRKPDFENYLQVMARERPNRPTLIEYFINPETMNAFVGPPAPATPGDNAFVNAQIYAIRAQEAMGYDFASVYASAFAFPRKRVHHAGARTISLNEGFEIVDRPSFEAFRWTEPDDFDTAWINDAARHLPAGMQFVVKGPGGVLENVIALVGYDNLCIQLALDPDLVGDIFDAVGARIVRYYELAVRHPAVGALLANDDWGFKTQTMLSTEQMRRYVFPWHKRTVEVAHASGRPIALHSCGCFELVADDIADDMRYDARHSYEDAILPVEEAYERYAGRFAIIGGLDVDFLCRATPEEVRRRALGMLERSRERGGYGLGSGNSLPAYIPVENIRAMLSAALD